MVLSLQFLVALLSFHPLNQPTSNACQSGYQSVVEIDVCELMQILDSIFYVHCSESNEGTREEVTRNIHRRCYAVARDLT